MPHRSRPSVCLATLNSLGAVVLMVSLHGCARSTSDRDLSYVDPFRAVEVMNAPQGAFGKSIDAAWVDPRPEREFSQGHIPGAINLPFPRMTDEGNLVLGRYGIIVIYGSDFQDILAVAASKRLMEIGFDSVYTLQGGLKAWRDAGNPVQADTPAVAPADLPAANP